MTNQALSAQWNPQETELHFRLILEKQKTKYVALARNAQAIAAITTNYATVQYINYAQFPRTTEATNEHAYAYYRNTRAVNIAFGRAVKEILARANLINYDDYIRPFQGLSGEHRTSDKAAVTEGIAAYNLSPRKRSEKRQKLATLIVNTAYNLWNDQLTAAVSTFVRNVGCKNASYWCVYKLASKCYGYVEHQYVNGIDMEANKANLQRIVTEAMDLTGGHWGTGTAYDTHVESMETVLADFINAIILCEFELMENMPI